MISNELSYLPFQQVEDSITKVKMVNCIFRDQVKKQNFWTFHMGILEIFADVILIRAETIKSFAIYFTICWTIFTSNNVPKTNWGAPLLGLAKYPYVKASRIWKCLQLRNMKRKCANLGLKITNVKIFPQKSKYGSSKKK